MRGTEARVEVDHLTFDLGVEEVRAQSRRRELQRQEGLQNIDDSLTRESLGRDRILRFAISRPDERLVAAWVGPELGPRILGRCKLFEQQHFARSFQLALGAGGR